MTTLPVVPHVADIAQQLIRFETVNPPGDEAACIGYIRDLLDRAGIPSMTIGRTDSRPNLIARLRGRGDAPPLLLQGHVDVVTTAGQQWTHPPFEGEIHDGVLWGRGALDMKGPVAMMLAAFLRAHAEGADLPGDVILCVLADEEAGSDYGAAYLTAEHPGLFDGVRYALGEFGGFSLAIRGRTFYPIMVAEKQICWMRATLHGPGGHGSMPIQGGAMARLGVMLAQLDRQRLPVHITPVVRDMVNTLARSLGFPAGTVLSGLLNPALTDRVLDGLGAQARIFRPLLRHSVSPNIVRGGDKVNVIPAEVTVELDGRLLPGFGPADLLAELRALLGPDVELEVLRHDPGPPAPDMGLFDTLAGILREIDPAGVPMPLLLTGVTDARFFARLGIQTYGFVPLKLPPGLDLVSTAHAADERVPVQALDFGAEAIYRALLRFG